MKKKEILVIIIGLLVVMAMCGGAIWMIMADKGDAKVQSFDKETVGNNKKEKDIVEEVIDDKKENVEKELKQENVNLTISELDNFTKYFAEPENAGFVSCAYNETSKINLYNVCINGLGKNVKVSEAENQAFMKATSINEIYEEPIIKMTTKEIKEIFKEKTGKEVENISEKLKEKDGWYYIAEYDAYYHENENYAGNDTGKCISGYKTIDDMYVITTTNGTHLGSTITLQKQGEKYLFISVDKY